MTIKIMKLMACAERWGRAKVLARKSCDPGNFYTGSPALTLMHFARSRGKKAKVSFHKNSFLCFLLLSRRCWKLSLARGKKGVVGKKQEREREKKIFALRLKYCWGEKTFLHTLTHSHVFSSSQLWISFGYAEVFGSLVCPLCEKGHIKRRFIMKAKREVLQIKHLLHRIHAKWAAKFF